MRRSSSAQFAWRRKALAMTAIFTVHLAFGTLGQAAGLDYVRIGHFPVLPAPWYFNTPLQVAFAPSGDFYVGNPDLVIRFTSAGALVRSWGRFGRTDGAFDQLTGIAVDSSGYVFTVDSFPRVTKARIQKFSGSGLHIQSWTASPTGYTSTKSLAIDSSDRIYCPSYGASGETARFTTTGDLIDVHSGSPEHYTVDSSGNIYAAFAWPNPINKLDANWNLIGFFGTYGTGPGHFENPTGVAVDGAGFVYGSDSSRNTIQKFDSTGALVSEFGGFGVEAGKLNGPVRIAIGPDGNLWVPEASGNRVSVFTRQGAFVKGFGSAGAGSGYFWNPEDLASDPSGNIFVCDTKNNRIQKFDRRWRFVRSWGSFGTGDGQFSLPTGIACDSSGNVYVADTGNARIQKFDGNGLFLRKWGTKGYDPGQLITPTGISVNPPGNVTVVDQNGLYHLNRFDEDGNFLNRWSQWTGDPGSTNTPRAVATDASGAVYVTTTGSTGIKKFSLDGTFIREFGSNVLSVVRGICVDRPGFVYAPDPTSSRVYKFDGNGNLVYTLEEPDFPNRFNAFGCDVTTDGDLLIADTGFSRVVAYRKGKGVVAGAAANAAGAHDTYWTSDVALANAGGQSGQARLSFHPWGQPGESREAEIDVSAGESVRLQDVVGTTFGLAGIGGSLLLDPGDREILASSRTSTPGPTGGSFGQGVPFRRSAPLVTAERPVHLVGLTSDDRVRTNVGMVNFSEVPCRFELDLYDARGSPLGHAEKTLSPEEPFQSSLPALFGLTDAIPSSRAMVTTPDIDCQGRAYASIVDNGTGDPVFTEASASFGSALTEDDFLIPAVTHSPGVAGTVWRSDLWLANVSEKEVSLAMILRSPSLPAPMSVPVTLAAGESRLFEDIVGATFGLSEATGFLELVPEASGIVARSRTFNVVAAGSFGQEVPAIARRDLFTPDRSAELIGLEASVRFRTNIAIQNVGSSTATFELDLFDRTGAMAGHSVFDLPGRGYRQWNDVTALLGATGDLSTFRATVSSQDAIAYFAWGSVVDNVTGDAVFEAGQ